MIYEGIVSRDSENRSIKLASILLRTFGTLVCFSSIIRTKLALLIDIKRRLELILESKVEYIFLKVSINGAKHEDGKSIKISLGASIFLG